MASKRLLQILVAISLASVTTGIFTWPSDRVKIVYEGNVNVEEGKELNPSQVINPPVHISWPTEPSCHYTLSMIDPDAPSRANPVLCDIKHLLIVNIPGTDTSQGQTLATYTGSKPYPGSGFHRYFFSVFKQPNCGVISTDEKVVDEKSDRTARAKFDLKKFAEKYNLGHPIAANFYIAQADGFVRKFYDENPIPSSVLLPFMNGKS